MESKQAYGLMKWHQGRLFLKPEGRTSWSCYTNFPHLKKNNYKTPKGSPGWATYQSLLKKGWKLMPTITMESYVKFVEETCTYKEPHKKDDLFKGLVGEYKELIDAIDEDNLILTLLELGDCFWYLVALTNAMGINMKLPQEKQRLKGHNIEGFMILGSIAEMLKKNFTYDTPPFAADDFKPMFDLLCEQLMSLSPKGYHISDILERNIEKLTRRRQAGNIVSKLNRQ